MYRLTLLAGLMIVYCLVFGLIAISIIQVLHTITEIICDLEKHHDILLAGALVAALVPSTAMCFWVYKIIVMRLTSAPSIRGGPDSTGARGVSRINSNRRTDG